LQQDQLKALGIIEALIKEVEKLNQRMKMLEQDMADAKSGRCAKQELAKGIAFFLAPLCAWPAIKGIRKWREPPFAVSRGCPVGYSFGDFPNSAPHPSSARPAGPWSAPVVVLDN
jgi:hypothetical protein